MEDYLLPKLTDAPTRFDCGWYNLTALDQLVHVNDARNGR